MHDKQISILMVDKNLAEAHVVQDMLTKVDLPDVHDALRRDPGCGSGPDGATPV